LDTSNEREAKRKGALHIAVHEASLAAAREFMRGSQPVAFAPENTADLVHDYKRLILKLDEVHRQTGTGASSSLAIPVRELEFRGMSEMDLAEYSAWLNEHEGELTGFALSLPK
jgi:hypothetical protein